MKRFFALIGACLAAAVGVLVVPQAAHAVTVSIYAIRNADTGECIYPHLFGLGVPGVASCTSSDAYWIFENGRIVDLSRSRCLTLNVSAGTLRTPGCSAGANPGQRWNFPSFPNRTRIVNPGFSMALQADSVLGFGPPSNSLAQQWDVVFGGTIEFPDNPTG
jgi:hypothetical protein